MAISCIGSLKGRGAIMTPRSLVGMTMGARRRRLWDEFFDEAWDGATIGNFRTEAAKYRLGQRLRPCPGNGCRRGQSWCLRCDGAGVVSAKPKKVRR